MQQAAHLTLKKMAVPLTIAILIFSTVFMYPPITVDSKAGLPPVPSPDIVAATGGSLSELGEATMQEKVSQFVEDEREYLREEILAKRQELQASPQWQIATASRTEVSRGAALNFAEWDPKPLLDYALSLQGVKYVYAGTNPETGLDCSAYTQLVFRHVGLEIPRTSEQQFATGVEIDRSSLEPGDLVFFSTSGPGASHVGIFLGEGNFISATTRGVRIQNLASDYWNRYYVGSRRLRP